jgi:hypothetical protein
MAVFGLGVFKSMYDAAKALKDMNDANHSQYCGHRTSRKNPLCSKRASGVD